jgi:siderophore synthetase component
MHLFGQTWMRQDVVGANWYEIEPILAVHMLVLGAREAGSATHRQVDVELLERILQSCQATKRYLDAADLAPPPPVGFIAAEQSLYFGHPLHPTPKSLRGMSNWQQDVYAPELRGGFQLTYFAAAAHLVREDSAGIAVTSIVGSLLGNDAGKVAAGSGEILLPMHPLQADALMLDPAVRALMASGQIRHVGPAGPVFTATSSVRTVYSEDAAGPEILSTGRHMRAWRSRRPAGAPPRQALWLRCCRRPRKLIPDPPIADDPGDTPGHRLDLCASLPITSLYG